MNEVLAFLLENRIVYLATVDGDIPKGATRWLCYGV